MIVGTQNESFPHRLLVVVVLKSVVVMPIIDAVVAITICFMVVLNVLQCVAESAMLRTQNRADDTRKWAVAT